MDINLEDIKKKYCGKYFKVVTDENRDIIMHRQMIYIKDIYQYFPESIGNSLEDYLDIFSKANDDGFINFEEERKKIESDPKYSEELHNKIVEHYNIPLHHFNERIEISNGISIQYIANLGEYGGMIDFMSALIIDTKDLVEISKEEYDRNYRMVIDAINNNMKMYKC